MKVRKKVSKKMVLLVVLFGILMCQTKNIYAASNSYDELVHINTADFFQQQNDIYYVYFYYEECPDCNYVKDDFINFAKYRDDIYLVDYSLPENKAKSYDWETLRSKYNKQIGTVDPNGNIEYFPGESKEKYMNCYNQYGKKITYTFQEIDGKLYTYIRTPEIDYASIKTPYDLVIAGVPTLLRVNNGVIDEFYYDYYEIYDFLEMQKLF